ncbi:hypothetical protein EUA50_03145 [Staphylococcus saprophyticus]|uniref:hypothetical protein n=1 Tax=Staphylococcus TaxID=1279 RepID=UPI000852D51A|nr:MULTISPECIES: hypothetical protein [Staphylococcus]MDL1993697.1 hypothetical protein [Staphylococcus saprophyticus]MDT3918231.1 hypothetical protein [Staphylococcus saprophyticus]MDT3924094.1 hypothetical protein [Staphylococcus saprophyticus]MDT3973864.1 hypothetical protein [Staphylococcus saprophyticus]MDT3977857.1 hypothetical protein [Staphylococcus saprophyticus]
MKEVKLKVIVDADEGIEKLEKVKSLLNEISEILKEPIVNITISNEADTNKIKKELVNIRPEISD